MTPPQGATESEDDTVTTEPLTPEEERQLRLAVSPSQTVRSLRHGDAIIRRLFATLEVARRTPRAAGHGKRLPRRPFIRCRRGGAARLGD